jgi:bifunctional non-homologous end joining protein LigD
MALETYRRKRNFRKTPEPRGKLPRKTAARLAFVIHKHAARRLHYDFRLEMAGVLASWAVPKGPSLDPKERRLAVEVEDHPFDYGGFEGTIPAGEYGAGKVIVWDRGYWVPVGDPVGGRRQGKLKFKLFGEKLHGGWTLVRIRRAREGGAKNNWLLIKENDEFAGAGDLVSERPESVSSGRTIEEIGSPQSARKSPPRGSGKSAPAGRTAPLQWIEPQLATLVTTVPTGSQWLHELKFDGYRLLCRIDNGQVSLFTRHAQDWTGRFPSVAHAAKNLPTRRALLDGEVVALEDDGTHSFQRLQNSFNGRDSSRLIYYAFDLLQLDGRDVRSASLIERKKLLKKLLSEAVEKDNTILRYSEHWIDQGEGLLAEACRAGLEGILSKRGDDPYQSGRTRSWLKIKCAKSQEFIIGGFTDPAGARVGFGALLLGVHENGALRYAGKVGTGFDERALRDLHARLRPLERAAPPFTGVPKSAEFRRAHWVEPRLVCEVSFAAWTTDGLLRHASFKGLREDKPPEEITRDVPVEAPPVRGSAKDDERVAGIKLTHPDRVLYPEQGITKRELARYYERVASVMLPHLEGRPLTVLRCPEGRAGQCFYQRHAREGITEPVQSIAVRERGKTARYLAVDSLPGLIALAQMGILEIHTWGSRAPHIERPDRLTFDLDPGEDVTWKEIGQGAVRLRARLEHLGLGAFLKTTGGKGLHVVVPIAPEQTWEFVKTFSRAVAESIVGEAPDSYNATASKTQRRGKIFIDYLRNSRTATAVCAYSTRARPGGPVSMPLDWADLKSDPRSRFTIRTACEFLEHRRTDPWRDYEDARRALTAKLLRRVK